MCASLLVLDLEREWNATEFHAILGWQIIVDEKKTHFPGFVKLFDELLSSVVQLT